MAESNQTPTFEVVEDLPQYFSNVIRINSSIYGFAFLFGHARPVGMSGGATRMSPICEVDMSPSHAKSVYLLLGQQLERYEGRWGEIPVPPDLLEKVGSADSD
jgi:hypothetical protein